MSIAVAALPRLPTEVLGLPQAEIRAVVVDDLGAKSVLRSVAVLVDATDAARALGVKPGMRVIDAQRYAPSLVVDVVKAEALAAELAIVAEVLLACSPLVEPRLPATWSGLPMACIALDVGGMVRPVARILTDIKRACARLKHESVVVATPGTRLSLAVARAVALRPAKAGGRDTVLIRDDTASIDKALEALPVSALELSGDLARQLDALGVRTAADLARLLPKGGVERLGAEARAVLDTLGATRTPLKGIVPPVALVEQLDLEHPVTALEPLGFILNNLCNRLCIRARARRERIAEVTLTCRRFRTRKPEALVVAFPDPLVDPAALLRSLMTRLERQRRALDADDDEDNASAAVDAVRLEATRLARRGPRQLSLPHVHGMDGAEAKAEEALTSLIAEMSAELGDGRAGCLVVTDEPLPERMTRLAWPAPPPPPRPPAPERRRPRRVKDPLPDDAVTRGGRFLAAWPWPLRLLPKPARFGGDVVVVRRDLLGVLEGDGKSTDDSPYARTYELVVLRDGRKALTLVDEELEDEWICGWFD